MGKKNKKTTKAPQHTAEDQRAEAVTVVWMLCIVATLMGDLFGFGGHFLLRLISEPAAAPEAVRALPGVMLFTALMTGLISVVLTPFVYRFRRSPPPAAITVFAITVATLPLIAGLVVTLRA